MFNSHSIVLVEDAFSSALDHSDDEAEQDAIVTQVLDEIGIDIAGKVNAYFNAPLILILSQY